MDVAVIIPAIVIGVTLWLFWKLLFKAKRLLMQGVGWMVVNGYYFPKIMREDLAEQIAANDRENERLDKIIDERSMR